MNKYISLITALLVPIALCAQNRSEKAQYLIRQLNHQADVLAVYIKAKNANISAELLLPELETILLNTWPLLHDALFPERQPLLNAEESKQAREIYTSKILPNLKTLRTAAGGFHV